MNNIQFLLCANPLVNKAPDFDYEEEYSQIKSHGYNVHLFDFDNFINGIKNRLPKSEIESTLIYRGWMLKPENYEKLYHCLSENNMVLINSPKQYEGCHTLPKWYDMIADVTPKSLWSEDLSDTAMINMLKAFGDKSIIIKDYVKSRKHEWHEACYIPNASDTAYAMKVIHTFIERQGSDLVGGIVIREYMSLKQAGLHKQSNMPISEEYRAFFLYGKLVCIIDYWNGYALNNDEICKFAIDISKRIDSSFFTVDIARTIDESLIVMEIGDGQVSGVQDFSEIQFYNNLNRILREARHED